MVLLTLLPFSSPGQKAASLITPFEIHKTNYTATYEECKDWYAKADAAFETVKVLEYGLTDGGHPLQLAVYSADKDFDPSSLRKKNKRIILVMNAIHPGEPEGVDASMLLLRDMATNKEWEKILKDVVVCIIPQYNIEGVINRGSFSRANQDGPESYGFRGNGENLDPNRDFIKCDSKNTKAFETLFQDWQPDVFIDNHVSDGADYQYVLTYISNTPGTLPPDLENFMHQSLTPLINKRCTSEGFEMTPYVDCYKESPDSGIMAFAATPRYSMGYTGLWNTLSYTVETHMLKPFDQRLKATYSFMKACINEVHENADKIGLLRKEATAFNQAKNEWTLQWKMDTAKHDLIDFKGYEAGHKPSLLTGAPRLYYDKSKPYNKKVPYFNYFKSDISVKTPDYYIVPQTCQKAVELLKMNRIEMQPLEKDAALTVNMYIIDDFENSKGKAPNNGHYLHHGVKLHSEKQEIVFHKGDFKISTSQPGIAYIMATLEPQGEDSYFAWNMFDGILQGREYFSDYVFEDIAWQFIQEHPEIKTAFEAKKKSDSKFASDSKAQIDWVYRQSPWFEKTYMRYPVGRVESGE